MADEEQTTETTEEPQGTVITPEGEPDYDLDAAKLAEETLAEMDAEREEPADDEPKAEAEQDPTEPVEDDWFSDEYKHTAESYDLDEETARSMGQEGLEKWFAAVDKRLLGDQPETQDDAGDDTPKDPPQGSKQPAKTEPEPDQSEFSDDIDLSEIDEVAHPVLKQLHSRAVNAERRVEALQAEIQQRFEQVDQLQSQMQEERFQQLFDASIRTVDPEIFGDKSWEETSPELFKNRQEVFQEVLSMYRDRDPRLPDLPVSRAIAMVYREKFSKQIEERSKSSSFQRIEQSSKKRLGLPGRSTGKRPANVPVELDPELHEKFEALAGQG